MLNSGNKGLRPQGVLVTAGQRETTKGTPLSVTGCAVGEMVLIEYFDAQGMGHNVVVMRFGNKFFMPPNAESWTRDCKPLSPWLQKALEDKFQAIETQSKPMPDLPESKVDIMPGGE